jgi:hypothetical protein
MNRILVFFASVTYFFCAGISAQTPTPLPIAPDLNVRATALVKPDFPQTATAAAADGQAVNVLVVVDEAGNVISAKCSADCHPMLKDAAEIAAATSKFRPLLDKNGQAIKYQGTLLYTFVVDRVDWYRFGTAFESVRQFDNISVTPLAQILATRYADERSRLLALDTKGTELETRWKVMREVESSLKTKLKKGELWRFEIGMALRLVTFWTTAAEQTNRNELRAAIERLQDIIAAAPSDIPTTTIEALTKVSKYQVPDELPERELRQAIISMTRGIRIQ